MRSNLFRQLVVLDPVQRRVCRLDGLAAVYEFALGYIESVSVSSLSTVGSALSMFRYGDELRQRFDVEDLVDDLRVHDRNSKVLRQWFGPASMDRIAAAARSDTERINRWAVRAFRDSLAVSQAVHIVGEIECSSNPDRWTLELSDLAGSYPRLQSHGMSPLAEVCIDAPMSDDPVWDPLWAMSSASCQLTARLIELGVQRKRFGAFEAALGSNSDRVSQGANSAIELMTRTAKALIKCHPDGAAWLGQLTKTHGHQPAKELLRAGVSVERGEVPGGLEGACRTDVIAAECVTAAWRLRGVLERLKHDDTGSEVELERLRRCLVAVEAVMILLVGIVQLRVDDPALTSEVRTIDLDELESFAQRTEHLVPTRAVLTYAAVTGADDPTSASRGRGG